MNEEKNLQAQEQNQGEEERLELDDLLNVQGGIEGDDKDTTTHSNCGLGCYTGGLNIGSSEM